MLPIQKSSFLQIRRDVLFLLLPPAFGRSKSLFRYTIVKLKAVVSAFYIYLAVHRKVP